MACSSLFWSGFPLKCEFYSGTRNGHRNSGIQVHLQKIMGLETANKDSPNKPSRRLRLSATRKSPPRPALHLARQTSVLRALVFWRSHVSCLPPFSLDFKGNQQENRQNAGPHEKFILTFAAFSFALNQSNIFSLPDNQSKIKPIQIGASK